MRILLSCISFHNECSYAFEIEIKIINCFCKGQKKPEVLQYLPLKVCCCKQLWSKPTFKMKLLIFSFCSVFVGVWIGGLVTNGGNILSYFNANLIYQSFPYARRQSFAASVPGEWAGTGFQDCSLERIQAYLCLGEVSIYSCSGAQWCGRLQEGFRD